MTKAGFSPHLDSSNLTYKCFSRSHYHPVAEMWKFGREKKKMKGEKIIVSKSKLRKHFLK